ncbi:hypothetical protein FOA52_006196 [Chlamydomonas sp. UWO 241]|nr:hypothetical protein FOA52_006196 [Chlamydomonas sp. UWO 241]
MAPSQRSASPRRRSTASLSLMPTMLAAILACLLLCGATAARELKQTPQIVAPGGAYTAGPACDGQSLHAECPAGQTISDVVTVFYGRPNTVTCPLAGNTGAMQYTGCTANNAAIMTAVDAACLNKASCDISAIHTAPGVVDPCGGTYKWLAITFNCVAAPTANPFATVAGFDAPLITQDSPGNDISRNYGLSLQACADLCSGLSNCVAFDWIASGPSAVHNGVPSPFCIPKYALTSLQAFYPGNVGALYKKAAAPSPVPAQSIGVACEGSTLSLSCASGTIASINAAFYGRDDTTTCQLAGNWGALQYTGCVAISTTIRSVVEGRCLGQASCTVPATNGDMGGDPCGGTAKYLRVAYSCV